MYLWRRKWRRRVSHRVEKRNRKKPLNRLEMYQVMKIVIKSRDSSIYMSREEHKMGACTSIDLNTVDRYSFCGDEKRPHAVFVGTKNVPTA
jgi:hypothetical protein